MIPAPKIDRHTHVINPRWKDTQIRRKGEEHTALCDQSTTVPVPDFHLLIGWTLTVALINGDISMNCWQQYMSTSERRERSRA